MRPTQSSTGCVLWKEQNFKWKISGQGLVEMERIIKDISVHINCIVLGKTKGEQKKKKR